MNIYNGYNCSKTPNIDHNFTPRVSQVYRFARMWTNNFLSVRCDANAVVISTSIYCELVQTLGEITSGLLSDSLIDTEL